MNIFSFASFFVDICQAYQQIFPPGIVFGQFFQSPSIPSGGPLPPTWVFFETVN